MANRFKAVIIGAAHMHVLYLAQDCLDNPALQLMGIADTPPLMQEPSGAPPFTRQWNLGYVHGRLGVPLYPEYIQMLDEVKPDLALITTETPLHLPVFTECAKRGIAVSMEKPMATTLSDGLVMARMARLTGTPLLVNWPLAWQPFMAQYSQILHSGTMGRLLRVRQLVGHPGPLGRGVRHPRVQETSGDTTGEQKAGTWWHNKATGGGAMLDFCCYGAMSCNWLTGEKAISATGMRSNLNSQWADADDNAAILVRYPSCMATLEGSWTVPVQAPSPGPELMCTEGTITCEQQEEGVAVVCQDFFGKKTAHPILQPEAHMRNVTTAFTHHKTTGGPLPLFLDIEQNLEVMAILDAGVRSAESGKTELVNSAAWQIG